MTGPSPSGAAAPVASATCGKVRRRVHQHGFTLVELTVVMAIMTIVLALFVTMLIPLGNVATQAGAIADNQQAVRFAADRITSDLRSANPLDTFSSSQPASTYTSQIELQLGTTGSPQSTVRWVFDPASQTLDRQVLSMPGGTVVSSTTVLTTVAQATFSYYSSTGTDLVAANPSNSADVALCAVRVQVVLTAQPNPKAPPFTDTVGATIRNQLPGGQSSCTYP